MDNQSSQKPTMDNSERIHHILVIEDTIETKTVELVLPSYSIGRHSSNDIVLSSPKASRHHATLLKKTDFNDAKHSYWLLDGDLEGNRSRNGILVNDKKCLIHELNDGDIIKFSAEATARYHITTNLSEIIELETNRATKKPTTTAVSEAERTILSQKSLQTQPPQEAMQYGLGRVNRSVDIKRNDRGSASLPSERLERDSSASIYSEREFANFAELCPQPIIAIDLYGQIKFLNSAAKQIFPNLEQQKLNHPLLQNLISQCNVNNNIFTREVVVANKVYQQKARYFSGSKLIRSHIADLTQKKAFEAQLTEQQALYQSVTRKISEGIVVVDAATQNIVKANSVCSTLLGYTSEEMLAMTIYDLSFEREKLADSLQKAIVEKVRSSGSCLLRHQNDTAVEVNLKVEPIESENSKLLCLIIDHLTAEHRVRLNDSEKKLTSKDVFYQQLLTAVANAKRSQKTLAIMFIDLGMLPEVSESLGSNGKNILLSSIEERLRSSLRSGDTVVRWQGSKFALLLAQIEAVEEAAKVCIRIEKALEQFFRIDSQHVNVNGNIGIAIYPQDGAELNVLLDNADTALHRAQKNNDCYQFFDPKVNSQTSAKLKLEKLLNKAIEREEFELCFQPQARISDREIQAARVAIDWEQLASEKLDCSPVEVAERMGLIIHIGKWLIATACMQGKDWQERGIAPLTLVVTLSPVQFQQISFPGAVERILSETEFEPTRLELNIPVATLMQDLEYARQTIERLRKLGVKISLSNLVSDRYSIAAFQQLAFDFVRIEPSIIRSLPDNPQNLAAVAALVELGKGFDFKIIAEGVETEAQAELLQGFPSDLLQSFWFSPALSPAAMTQLLRERYLQAKENPE